MKTEVEKRVGICGLYCGSCPSYLAFRKNDAARIEKMSREKGCSADELRCDGCLSNRVSVHCRDCRHGFRRCAAEKQVTWCFECPDFPCERLEKFVDVHIVDGISHHEHIIAENADLKLRGVEAWVKKQEKAARCPGCGETLYWCDRECPSCHTTVR